MLKVLSPTHFTKFDHYFVTVAGFYSKIPICRIFTFFFGFKSLSTEGVKFSTHHKVTVPAEENAK